MLAVYSTVGAASADAAPVLSSAAERGLLIVIRGLLIVIADHLARLASGAAQLCAWAGSKPASGRARLGGFRFDRAREPGAP